MIALGIFDQIADRFSAAAAGHVLKGRLAQKARLGQRFTGSASGSIPSSSGTAGNEKMNCLLYTSDAADD